MAEKKSSGTSTADKKSTSKSSSSSAKSVSSTKKSSSSGKSSKQANVNRVVKAAKKYDTDKSFVENKEAVAGVVKATATSAGRASNKKQKKIFIAVLIILIIAIAGVCVYGYYQGWFNGLFGNTPGNPDNPNNANSAEYDIAAIKNENISIHFLELGNIYTGDCVYIKAGDTDILIDAGSKNDSATTITEYLNQYVTDGKLEYVIATHAHEDHLAGFYSTANNKGIFENFKTDVIIDFALSAKTYDNKTVGENTLLGRYIKARDAEVAAGAKHYTAAQCFNETDGAKRVYEIADGVTLEILYNYYYFNYDLNSKGNINAGENNYSVCCMINDGDNHYLFTGDLESDGEEALVNYYNNGNDKNLPKLPHCNLYKAGHHGSKTSSSTKLMDAITPNIICVCCCAGTSEYTADNNNQFPTQDFIDRVAKHTDCVYVTTVVDKYVATGWKSDGTVKSMNGNIVYCHTGSKETMRFTNNSTKLKDTDWFKNNRVCPDAWK